MSKYTTQLRFICESLSGEIESKGYNSINEIISGSRDKIFSFDYPLFDPEYKPTLEEKIIKHYYTREICAETFGRWKLFLESRLLEIMPYYNQLYESALMKYDIFEDVNYLRTGNRTGEESGENSNTGSTVHAGTDTLDGDYTANSVGWSKYSDTPQGSVQNIDNDSYLTNATKNTSDDESTTDETRTSNYTDTRTDNGEHSKNTLEEYSELIKGKMPGKSYMQMVQEFRDVILNIDKMIIDDLSDLFMMVY